MADEPNGLRFSQRHGLASVPPQLQLGELPTRLRNQLHYPVHCDMQPCVKGGYDRSWITGRWLTILRDHWVEVDGKNVGDFSDEAYGNEKFVRWMFEQARYDTLFDFVEFLLAHRETQGSLKKALAAVLVQGRAAYRIIGDTVVPVGNSEQAEAVERAVLDAMVVAPGSARHLLAAGADLRRGSWAGSVRESIHAVEAVAVMLAPGKDTMSAALAVLEKQGHLHGSLKSAFNTLYGYTSDEEGIRHALVFNDEAHVDETDALFMLGACAAFVSYLLARAKGVGASPPEAASAIEQSDRDKPTLGALREI